MTLSSASAQAKDFSAAGPFHGSGGAVGGAGKVSGGGGGATEDAWPEGPSSRIQVKLPLACALPGGDLVNRPTGKWVDKGAAYVVTELWAPGDWPTSRLAQAVSEPTASNVSMTAPSVAR
jgi:hypothetical protein